MGGGSIEKEDRISEVQATKIIKEVGTIIEKVFERKSLYAWGGKKV